jgi:hypothetical protein
MNNRPAVVSDLFFVAGMVVVILFPAMQATGIMAEYFRASKHPKTLNIQVYTVVNKYNAIFRTFFSLRLSQVKI